MTTNVTEHDVQNPRKENNIKDNEFLVLVLLQKTQRSFVHQYVYANNSQGQKIKMMDTIPRIPLLKKSIF